MSELTNKEQRHVNRIYRILNTAVKALDALNDNSIRYDVFPNTTRKALAETMEVLHRAKIRVMTRNASVV